MAIIRFLLVLSGTLAVNIIKQAVFDEMLNPKLLTKLLYECVSACVYESLPLLKGRWHPVRCVFVSNYVLVSTKSYHKY